MAFLVSSPLEPTHMSIKGTSDVLDIAITKNTRIASNLIRLVDLSSTHFPRLFEIGFKNLDLWNYIGRYTD
jgi:hypothetical protein